MERAARAHRQSNTKTTVEFKCSGCLHLAPSSRLGRDGSQISMQTAEAQRKTPLCLDLIAFWHIGHGCLRDLISSSPVASGQMASLHLRAPTAHCSSLDPWLPSCPRRTSTKDIPSSAAAQRLQQQCTARHSSTRQHTRSEQSIATTHRIRTSRIVQPPPPPQHVRQRIPHSQGHRQSHQGERPAEVAILLSDVRKAMQR